MNGVFYNLLQASNLVDFGCTPQLRFKSSNPGWNLQWIPVKILPPKMPMEWMSGNVDHHSLEMGLPLGILADRLAPL